MTNGTFSSRNFKVLRKCKKIYASANHSFAITDSEDVYAWGDNSLGVLGLPQFIGKNVTLPQIIQFNTLRSQSKLSKLIEHLSSF